MLRTIVFDLDLVVLGRDIDEETIVVVVRSIMFGVHTKLWSSSVWHDAASSN